MRKLILLLAFISIFLSSCEDYPQEIKRKNKNLPFEYSIITIEGMPCMVVESYTYYNHYVENVNCDWSKWKGE